MFNFYPWQQENWQFLTGEVSQNRLAQALLLHGSSGLGKQTFATAFAAYVLCDRKGVIACGECQSCRWFKAGSHPDFFRIALEEKSKAIKVDQLRTLTKALEQTSQRGAYQVALIESASTMNRAAANALLKTLEEPAGQVMIMLVADRLHTLPATIISRCQRVAFTATADQDTLGWLQQQLNDKTSAERLLKAAESMPLRALQYQKMDYFKLRDDLLKHLLAIQANKVDPVSPLAAFLKQELSLLLTILLSLIADVLRLQHGVKPEVLVHSDRLPQLTTLQQAHQQKALHDYFQCCQKALASVENGAHLNPQLLLENVFVEYYQCCHAHVC